MTNKISTKAQIANNTTIGTDSIIYDNVVIEEGVTIGDFCSIGLPDSSNKKKLVIGKNSTIRSHSVIYQGSEIGQAFESGHHTLIRSGAKIGRNFRLGSYSSVEGNCVIGNYTTCHGYVQIGQGASIGNFVWICSLVTVTNDPIPPSFVERPVVLEDGVVVCVNATLLPGTVMKKGSYAAAGTLITGEIPPGSIVQGSDCRKIGHISTLIDFKTGTRHPWMNHFKEKFPEEAWEEIEVLKIDIKKLRFK